MVVPVTVVSKLGIVGIVPIAVTPVRFAVMTNVVVLVKIAFLPLVSVILKENSPVDAVAETVGLVITILATGTTFVTE